MQASFLLSLLISNFALAELKGEMMLLAILKTLISLAADSAVLFAVLVPCLGAILSQHLTLPQLKTSPWTLFWRF